MPFALFVSLSASDNVLPTMNSEGPAGGADVEKKKGQTLIMQVVDGFRNWFGEAGTVLGWWKKRDDRFV